MKEIMKEIRNLKGKLVCCLGENGHELEIVRGGCKTCLRFSLAGEVNVVNTFINPLTKFKKHFQTSKL
ncbi:MAG: hypothetical protein LBK29_02540 [Oscillospiraceae bacterium]|jgi:hypothetical protein|nr:hypothetical protein [Oscillospiraceae bacterium]